MTESIAIMVERHRDPDGYPTCRRWAGKQQCRFLGARHFGTVDVCMLTGADLERGLLGAVAVDGIGWVRPADGCPVWPVEASA